MNYFVSLATVVLGNIISHYAIKWLDSRIKR